MRYTLTLDENAARRDIKRAEEAACDIPGVRSARADVKHRRLRVSVFGPEPTAEAIALALQNEGISASVAAEEDAARPGVKPLLAWLLALVSVYISLGMIWALPLPHVLSYPVSAGITQEVLMLCVWALCGEYFNLKRLFSGHDAPDTYLFAVLAALCACAYSVPALIVAASRVSQGMDTGLSLFFDCAALLPVLMTLGRSVEGRERKRTRRVFQKAGFQLDKDESQPRIVHKAYLLGRCVAVIALLIALGALALGFIKGERLAFAVSAAVCVLTVACPGVPGRAASAALFRRLAGLCQAGVKLKSARALEELSEIKLAVFELDGGLYGEEMSYEGCVFTPGVTESMLLSLAASALQGGEDAVSRAVLARAEELSVPLDPLGDREGEGINIRAQIGDTRVIVGEHAFMLKNALDMSAWEDKPDILAQDGCTGLYIAGGGKIKGVLALRRVLLPGAVETVKRLKELGVETALASESKDALTGALARRVQADKMISHEDAEMELRLLNAGKEKYLYIRGGHAGPMENPRLTMDLAGGDAVISGDIASVSDAVLSARGAIGNVKKRLGCFVVYELICLPLAAGLFHIGTGYSLTPLIASPLMLAVNWLMLRGSARAKREKTHKK